MPRIIVQPLTDIETAAGYVRFDVTVEGELEGGNHLRVLVDGSGFEDFPWTGKPLRIGVHTHLLNAGRHVVDFQLRGPRSFMRRSVRASATTTITLPERSGLHDQVRSALEKNQTPLIFEGPCDSAYYPYSDTSLTAWFDRPDAIEKIASMRASGSISALEAQYLIEFVRDGFIVMESAIDDELIAAVNADIDDAVAKGYQGYTYGSSQRIEHLHEHYDAVRRLWLDSRHRRIVGLIFGAPARPCQTLTYLFGSQQDDHTDLVHLTPFPAGMMCGTWIALQDVVPDSGELVVYKGSHRARRLYLNDAKCGKVKDGDWSEFGAKVVPVWADIASNYERIVYRPKKGTVLIWHENLMHGGSIRRDQSLERRSIVIHSFADGAIVYYDSTGNHGYAASLETLRNAA
ncbi:hypothetical protein CAL14_19710 [Bordetella genomosp. 9]|uniref:phytanoyl-CoA dioxygenase family protein n=1 Tax=Bordetella genomosp. 9 TaxID=1416803 RepID=UPI000A28FECC|nr:phytanoyl-CoA dioxygenase family protein [Bordetella genomosp. 9]ARP92235.1 hypothetical protein CAL14_19710 [Bordetella genomosp. 9]